jgi:hypothetical protein
MWVVEMRLAMVALSQEQERVFEGSLRHYVGHRAVLQSTNRGRRRSGDLVLL